MTLTLKFQDSDQITFSQKLQCDSKFQACGCCGCCQIPSVTLYLVERQVALYVEEPDKIADLVSKARYKKFYK